MTTPLVFNFNTNISDITIPEKLNNPFGVEVPEITKVAVNEFQEFLTSQLPNFSYDFTTRPGKMFGVLVIKKPNGNFGYLGAMSGTIAANTHIPQLVPSVFDESTDDFFFTKSMKELTLIGNKIKESVSQLEIENLKQSRKQKSHSIQQWLFQNYSFLNILGAHKNVLEIFNESSHGKPPAAAGECAGPKLLNYAFAHQLKPIAITEFWWGNTLTDRENNQFYPACKNKCRPILEYMLNDFSLYKD